MLQRFFLLSALMLLFPNAATGQQAQSKPSDDQKLIEPIDADYSKLAFYPNRWKAADADFNMLAWEGSEVVFLTRKGEYNAKTMTNFVQRLDKGWSAYRDLVGKAPRKFRQLNGKPTICAIPVGNLSCGYGCGYVNATGIEVSAFYKVDLPEFKKDPQRFQHYYFYEMGRNYFVFEDRHSLFTTGFAVFMRYVCMDQLECSDSDQRTRKTIEECEAIYANSKLGFFDTFTNLGSGEKSNRLRSPSGQIISPSDQPVMYATAMLKLRNDFGGDKWVKRFFHFLMKCHAQKATDIRSARKQCYNWLVCASAAANKDLTSTFVDRWRMPFNRKQRKTMKSTDWQQEDIPVAKIVKKLLSADP